MTAAARDENRARVRFGDRALEIRSRQRSRGSGENSRGGNRTPLGPRCPEVASIRRPTTPRK